MGPRTGKNDTNADRRTRKYHTAVPQFGALVEAQVMQGVDAQRERCDHSKPMGGAVEGHEQRPFVGVVQREADVSCDDITTAVVLLRQPL